MEYMRIRDTIKDLKGKYSISSNELAKITFIVSTTFILVGIPTALEFQNASNKLDSLEGQISRQNAVLSNDRVETSIEALQNTQGSSFSSLSAALESIKEAERSEEMISEVNSDMEENLKGYQWLVLIGIIGDVTAIAIFLS